MGWDRIVSIESLGRGQVYDIEVEGTHNFIGNRIFAHNTYLNGNVGIGTTSPAAKLHVSSGTVLIDGYATTAFQVGQSTFVVAASGNVGPGIAAPRTALDAGSKTDGLILPTGTQAQRPTTLVAGTMRYTTTNANGGGGGGGVLYAINQARLGLWGAHGREGRRRGRLLGRGQWDSRRQRRGLL